MIEGAPSQWRILVADDDLVSRLAMDDLLRRCGTRSVVLAEDGIAAWERLSAEGCFDLVCLDLRMPAPDGLELVARMRVSPAMKRLPVMLITSASEGDTVAAARGAQLQGFVRKPISDDTVGAVCEVLTRLDAAILEPPAAASARLGIERQRHTGYVTALVQNLRQLATAAQALERPDSDPSTRSSFMCKAQACRSAALALGALRINEVVGDALAAAETGVAGAAQALELAVYWLSRVSSGEAIVRGPCNAGTDFDRR